MKRFLFLIKRQHSSPLEKMQVLAKDQFEAVSSLPKCVSWQFAIYKGGH